MTETTPLQRRTEKISEMLAREIVHDMHGLEAGTMLPPEAAMLEKYQVGRASLREALRILEVQGLIVIRPGPGGGPMVAPVESRDFAKMASLYLYLSEATYRDVVASRLVLEPVMARLAAERQDPEELARLEQFIVPPGAVLADRDYIQSSSAFHGLLSGLSGNPVLDIMGRSLKDVFTDRIEQSIVPQETRARMSRDHAAIAKAIIGGQAAKAERLMREHMVKYLGLFEEQNPGLLDEVVDWR